jgi:hypothetical protein
VKVVLLIVAFALGCAKNVSAKYPSNPSDATGTLVLTMANTASGVSVAVNGILVVEDAKTSRIVIESIPVGTAEVIMAANGADKAFRAWITSEHPTTVPLGVPEEGSGFIKSLFGSLVTIVVYSLLR